MYKHILVLPDGTEISSGTTDQMHIQSVSFQECVNASQELTLGSTCACMMDLTLFASEEALRLSAGEEVTLYEEDSDGTRVKMGLFILEKPTRPSANTVQLLAYDRVVKLDKDLTSWFKSLTEWPYTLNSFAHMVCNECGLTLARNPLLNNSYLIQKFDASGITGRQLIEWVGQIAGSFCRATPEGTLEFGWYTPVDICIGASQPHNEVAQQSYYFQGGLSFEEYSVARIEKVQIQTTPDDVGIIYPNIPEDLNTYKITGNYLLNTETSQGLSEVIESLYAVLHDVTYTPCSISIPANSRIRAGNIVHVTDINGTSFTTYVMTRKRKGQRDTLECTGSPTRTSTTVVNNLSLRALNQRTTELKIDLEGVLVKVTHVEEGNKENAALMQILNNEISTRVSQTEHSVEGLQKQYTDVSHRADGFDISITSISNKVDNKADQSTVTEITERLRFTSEGLTITNSSTGMGIGVSEERVVFTGGKDPTTVITPNAMETTNLTVGTRLDVGDFSLIPRTNGNLSLRYTGGR